MSGIEDFDDALGDIAGDTRFGGGGGMGPIHNPSGSLALEDVAAEGVIGRGANGGGTAGSVPMSTSDGALGGRTHPEELDAPDGFAAAGGNKSPKPCRSISMSSARA